MRATVTITGTAELRQIIRRYDTRGSRVRLSEAICAGLDRANQLVVARVQTRRLNGVGPFPVSQHRLGHRTRRLVRSFGASRARVVSAARLDVRAALGSNVRYFGPHEFGFEGQVKVRGHQRDNGVRVREHMRHVRIPERRMVRTELETSQTQQIYRDHLTREIKAALTR